MKEQADTFFMEALEYAKQVGERSTEPVHGPCRDHVELFRVHRLHHGIERRTLIPALGVADSSILVNFDDLSARTISYRFQFSALIFGVLLRRADANVECDALHDDLPAKTTYAMDT
jgi:hypothetical protein